MWAPLHITTKAENPFEAVSNRALQQYKVVWIRGASVTNGRHYFLEVNVLNSKTVKILVLSLLLSACTTTQRPHQSQMPPEGYYEPLPQRQNQGEYAPQYRREPIVDHRASKSEIYFRTFCDRHGVRYKSDECRSIFLKEWARESVEAGGDLSKEGFSQIDEFMRTGSRKIGEKWGEYAREFKRGARKGWRRK